MTILTDYVKASTGLSESTIIAVHNSTVAFISNSLRNGEFAKVEQLGIFKNIDKPERDGRNPRTGQPTTFKASRRVKLVFGKNFVASIQSGFVGQIPEEQSGEEDDDFSSLDLATIPEMPSELATELMPQSPYFIQLPESITSVSETSVSVSEDSVLLSKPTETIVQTRPMWKIQTPDGSFIEVLTDDLKSWGVKELTPVYSLSTGWKLASQIPELAGLIN